MVSETFCKRNQEYPAYRYYCLYLYLYKTTKNHRIKYNKEIDKNQVLICTNSQNEQMMSKRSKVV